MYSKPVRYYLMNPVNGTRSGYYNAEGSCNHTARCATNPSRVVENTVKFRLLIEDGNIKSARWSIFGDPVASAAASWCVENILGKDINSMVHVITPERMALCLEIEDEIDIRAGCTAAINALISALDDYRNEQNKG